MNFYQHVTLSPEQGTTNDQLTENILAVCPVSYTFHYDESVEAGNKANKIQGS